MTNAARSLDNLRTANTERSRTGRDREIAAALRALHNPRRPLTERQRDVLNARIRYPHDDLTTLGARLGITKHATWGLLRRAIDGTPS